MADRVDDPQLHDLACQQPQRPVPVARRRRSQTQRDQLRLVLAVEELRHGRAAALLPVQRQLEALQHTAPPHILHGSCAAPVGLRDLLVSPARPVHIRLEQNPGASRLLVAAL